MSGIKDYFNGTSSYCRISSTGESSKLSKLYLVYITVRIFQAWHLEDWAFAQSESCLLRCAVGVSRNDLASFFKKAKRISWDCGLWIGAVECFPQREHGRTR